MAKAYKYLLLAVYLLISCNNKPENNTDVAGDKLSKKETDSLKGLVEKLDKIKIISFEKDYMESSLPDSTACKTWTLKKSDLQAMILSTKQIDFEDIHYLFETQTCSYKGIFKLEEKEYMFVINSGGWIHLKFNNITLGCFDKSCEKFFLGKVDKPEDAFKN